MILKQIIKQSSFMGVDVVQISGSNWAKEFNYICLLEGLKIIIDILFSEEWCTQFLVVLLLTVRHRYGIYPISQSVVE